MFIKIHCNSVGYYLQVWSHYLKYEKKGQHTIKKTWNNNNNENTERIKLNTHTGTNVSAHCTLAIETWGK